jgi:hypothetical protein
MTINDRLNTSQTRIYSELKRGLIIGRKDVSPGKNPFFIMMCFGANSTGTILDTNKMVAASMLFGILMVISAKIIQKVVTTQR